MKPRQSLIPLLILSVLLVGAWYFRPLLHGYIFAVWADPLGTLLLTAGIVALALAGGLHTKAYVRAKLGRPMRLKAMSSILPLLVGVLLLVGAVFYKVAAQDLRLAQAYRTYTFENITTLPADDQSRLVPLPVAQRFGADSLQRSTEKAHAWYPQLWDGKFSWVAGLTPNSPVRQWIDHASGLQVVDATTTQRSTQVANQTFKLSEGVQLTDNIRWQLYKQRYLVDLPEAYHAKVGSRIYAVVPIITYQGFLIRHPVLDGAFIVSADGVVEELTTAQAKVHPAVQAAGRLYPESYIRFVHESYALKHGLVNKWFRHVDQTEISDPAGESNAQPYMLSTKAGLVWLSAADPWGQSFGIYKIFITNAITGRHQLYSVPPDAALTGAAQAIGYVKSARPQYNWRVDGGEDAAGSGNIIAIEPRPIFVQGQLYWMVSVTTTEAKGVNETCFVHAKDNQVACAVNDSEIKAFVATGSTKATQPTPDSPNNTTASSSTAPHIKERVEKLEATLRQALRELEELKTSQP